MKTHLNNLVTIIKTYDLRVIASVLVLSLVVGVTAYAGGPVRQTYTSASPADHVVFNSITDNPIHGDERNSVLIREAGVGTYQNDIALQVGKEYEVYSYYHNNAKSSLNTGAGTGIARNVRMSVQMPSVVAPGERGIIGAAITASNANPQRVWDEAYVTSASTVSLRYVPSSARITSSGAINNSILSDALFSTNGTFLGYDELNGIVPGCADYAGYVIYRFKVDQPAFTVAKEVANSGKNNWAETVTAKAGATVDYRILYKNTGTTDQNNVTIKDVLPAGQTYVNGSSKLINATNPGGLKVSDNVVGAGINIGTYGPGASATVTFSAKLGSNDKLPCARMVNTASVITTNGTKTDTAGVTPDKDCVVTELPTTGPVEVIAGLVGIAAITVGIVYYLKSRKDLDDALHSAQSHPSMTKTSEKIEVPRGH